MGVESHGATRSAKRCNGSLLLAGIEVEPSAGEHPFKQLLQLLWRGPIRVRPPVAHEHYPRLQPTPHSHQRHRPAQWTLLRASLLDLPFFPTRYLHGGGGSFRAFFEGCPRWCRRLQRACTSPPAEGERAAHQLPVAPDRDIFSDLLVGPPDHPSEFFTCL